MTTRTSARVLLRDRSASEVLLVAVRNSSAPAGFVWTPPGGAVQIGETLERAATRELFEELKIRVSEDCLRLLAQAESTFVFEGQTINQRDVVFIADWLVSSEYEVNAPEIDARWFTSEDLAALPPDRVAPTSLLGYFRKAAAGEVG